MDKIKDLVVKIFTNRRGWVVLVPVIATVAGFFGLSSVTPEVLLANGDAIEKGIMALLALGSLFMPKAGS